MCKPSSMSPCHFNPNPLVRRLELYAAFCVQRPIVPRAVSFPRKLEWTRSVSKGKRLAVSVTQNSTWKLILHKTLELSRKGFRNHLVQLLHVTDTSSCCYEFLERNVERYKKDDGALQIQSCSLQDFNYLYSSSKQSPHPFSEDRDCVGIWICAFSPCIPTENHL
ncbi:hypothetical protein R6Z07F_010126 [Ovis aries]